MQGGFGECCDEQGDGADPGHRRAQQGTEDCSSGVPATCNVGCASVLIPFFEDCGTTLGKQAMQFDTVVALCRAAEAAEAAAAGGTSDGDAHGGMGEPCTDDDECHGLQADFCHVKAGDTMGKCMITGCATGLSPLLLAVIIPLSWVSSCLMLHRVVLTGLCLLCFDQEIAPHLLPGPTKRQARRSP